MNEIPVRVRPPLPSSISFIASTKNAKFAIQTLDTVGIIVVGRKELYIKG
jgi:hypothetical protein